MLRLGGQTMRPEVQTIHFAGQAIQSERDTVHFRGQTICALGQIISPAGQEKEIRIEEACSAGREGQEVRRTV
jgi:hypothetical protein